MRVYMLWWGNLRGRTTWKTQVVDERLILKWNLKEWIDLMQTEFCENGTEPWAP